MELFQAISVVWHVKQFPCVILIMCFSRPKPRVVMETQSRVYLSYLSIFHWSFPSLHSYIFKRKHLSLLDFNFSEIVKKLTETSSPPFRPEIDPQLCTDEIRSIIQACWEEIPENRPATTDLLSSMKKINK